MIPGYQSSSKIREISAQFKNVAKLVEGHVILIGHLNQAGSVKGNNDIQYMIDVEVSLRPYESMITKQQRESYDRVGMDIASLFLLTMGKNRYGPTVFNGCQNYVLFRHTATGIECVTSNFSPTPLIVGQIDESPEELPEILKKWTFFGR